MAVADDVTRFAELLAHLKTRTDRSYAALARRLDMNASTLHRYCAGEAVPLDFGVVERFAALCGASPRERVELHRLWILAVAERRRSRPAGTGRRPGGTPRPPAAAGEPAVPADGTEERGTEGQGRTPEPGTTPAPLATPASPTPPTSLTAPAPDATPAPDTTPSRDAAAEPAPPDAPTLPDTPAATPAPDTAPAHTTPDAPRTPEAGTASGAAPATVGGRPSRAWYRRRPAVVSSVLGTVFLLTAAGLSALPGFPDALTQDSPGGAASPHHGPSASPTGTPARPSAPAAPFTWAVNSHVWEGDCGHDYVIGRPPRQVPPPPSAEDAEVWANAQDAVHGGETIVRVSVQGRTSAAVVLEALHVRVVRRAAPPDSGAFVYDTSPGCGGGITPRSFAVSLDKRTPVARAVPGSRGDTILPARRFPYRVSVEDPEVLMVDARTKTCACEWYLDLDWSSQGSTGTIRIDDHGRPFRTTGITGLPLYRYADSPRQWVPESPRN
ncbi:helix-turn-helix domain-containing protein [Streptomyces sp. NPDC021080]|uniref:helix-turn-helix domain-containing protein n=1 Tax=Streptomyces sp. NPDC021080 TaxID=3365110 RepID=UPI0037994FF0